MFTKREVGSLAVSILLLGLVFGFDDGQPAFAASFWIKNLIIVILLVAASVLLRELFIKLTASKFQAKSEYDIWLFERYWFKAGNKIKPGIPFGVILALLGSLISMGQFFKVC